MPGNPNRRIYCEYTLANRGSKSIAQFQFKLIKDNHLIKILDKFPTANDWRDVGYATK